MESPRTLVALKVCQLECSLYGFLTAKAAEEIHAKFKAKAQRPWRCISSAPSAVKHYA